jgi:hypothetical protein
LQQLAWLVGTWSDQDEDATVRFRCEWVKNNHFLKSFISAKTSDGSQIEVVQLIGWDPDAGQIRSWVFDSNGGFATGLWRRAGRQWISEPTFTRDDGARGSAMNIYTLVDNDTFKWQCASRTNSGAALPGIDEVTLRRGTAIEDSGTSTSLRN